MLLRAKRVMVLLTTHNRREQTLTCIRSLRGAEGVELCFVVADAGSTDGTAEALTAEPDVRLLHCGDTLYWNGGMRRAMAYAARYGEGMDYVLLANDDVCFYKGALRAMLRRLDICPEAAAVVGATRDAAGEQTYGGVRMLSRRLARYELISPTKAPQRCDTFNCNALLLRYAVFRRAGSLDRAYVHSMGDYDYGMKLRRRGEIVVNSAAYVGVCEGNGIQGSWRDPKLPRRERLRKKESAKGLPRRDWYYFVRKNYSVPAALYHSATPYLRILLGR